MFPGDRQRCQGKRSHRASWPRAFEVSACAFSGAFSAPPALPQVRTWRGRGCEWVKDLEDPMGKWDGKSWGEPLSFSFFVIGYLHFNPFFHVSAWLGGWIYTGVGLRTWNLILQLKELKELIVVPSMSSIKGSTLVLAVWKLFGCMVCKNKQGVWMKAGHLSFRLFQAFAHPHATSTLIKQDHKSRSVN